MDIMWISVIHPKQSRGTKKIKNDWPPTYQKPIKGSLIMREANETLFVASKGEEDSQGSMWYLDTKASNHMCENRYMFVDWTRWWKGE